MNNNSDLALVFDTLGRGFDSRPHNTIVVVATLDNSSEEALQSDMLGRGFDFRHLFFELQGLFCAFITIDTKK